MSDTVPTRTWTERHHPATRNEAANIVGVVAAHPVLMMVFNRPELAEQLARIVAAQRPPRVYVACDGPRERAEQAIVAETQARVRAVLSEAQVPCRELSRPENLGCKRAVEDAIRWLFEHEDAAMILEDDCQPSPAFFEFCDDMLDRYRDDDRVMHVSGYSEQAGTGYRYSRFPAVWGWATWKRAWQHYPTELPSLDRDDLARLAPAFARREHLLFFAERWARVRCGRLDTWDFSWVYAVRSQGGLAIQPIPNLVRNRGVGDPRAAHTRRADARVEANPATEPDSGSFVQPIFFVPDDATDHRFFRSRMAGRLPLARSAVRYARFAGSLSGVRLGQRRPRGE